jgi:hypothetical protein
MKGTRRIPLGAVGETTGPPISSRFSCHLAQARSPAPSSSSTAAPCQLCDEPTEVNPMSVGFGVGSQSLPAQSLKQSRLPHHAHPPAKRVRA